MDDHSDGQSRAGVDSSAGPSGDVARARNLLLLSVVLSALGVVVVAVVVVARSSTPELFTLAEVEIVTVLACMLCPALGALTLGLAWSMGGRGTALARWALAINGAALLAAGSLVLSTLG